MSFLSYIKKTLAGKFVSAIADCDALVEPARGTHYTHLKAIHRRAQAYKGIALKMFKFLESPAAVRWTAEELCNDHPDDREALFRRFYANPTLEKAFKCIRYAQDDMLFLYFLDLPIKKCWEDEVLQLQHDVDVLKIKHKYGSSFMLPKVPCSTK